MNKAAFLNHLVQHLSGLVINFRSIHIIFRRELCLRSVYAKKSVIVSFNDLSCFCSVIYIIW